ncbi:hypothetical protein AX17_000707 [Amanita inopinata Kibby_2008]|nr:hypothetical protein AX17_000707 [Amanita inopinata Kibby_2008]
MIILTRNLKHASWNRLPRPPHLALAHRAFSAVRKTRKSFAELPDALVLPDGTRAPPLCHWQGGHVQTEDVCKTQRRRGRKKADDPQPSAEVGIIDGPPNAASLSPKKTIKRPRKQRSKEDTPESSRSDGQPRNNLAREILDNLNRFPHCLLLTRVGQFYESYFDQAVEIARLLNIKLTSRKWDGQRIHMCGFPVIHIDKYLKVLVQQNKRFIALCEEFPRYSEFGFKEFERRVVRIVTPGTLIDEPFLNPYENNYLLAVSTAYDSEINMTSPPPSPVGLAWMDVSTGEFYSKVSTCESLVDELTRINPKEVVLDEKMRNVPSHPVLQALAEENSCISYIVPSPIDQSLTGIHRESSPPVTYLDRSPIHSDSEMSLSTCEVSSVNLLNTFLRANLLDYMPSVSSPSREVDHNRMQIDSHTIKALEIREGMNDGGAKGSLLSCIKRTTTTGGTRLLARWLCSPSTSLSEINARQSLVACLFTRPHFRADLVEMLAGSEDIGRITQKFLLGRGDPGDLLALCRTIRVWSSIKRRIEEEERLEMIERPDFNKSDWTSMNSLMSRTSDLDYLSTRIANALEDEEGNTEGVPPDLIPEQASGMLNGADVSPEAATIEPLRFGNGRRFIKPSFSNMIASLHEKLCVLLEQRASLERHLQKTYDAPSLSLRMSPAHGLHVHLSKARRDQTKLNGSSEFICITESASTKCYFNKEWSLLGSQIAETTMALTDAEKEAFDILRSEVNIHATSLRRNAHILDELDIALAFASLAADLNLVKPTITSGTSYRVTGGRHPTVEMGLLTSGRVFTPNSVEMTPDSRLHIITGPNMAGKSTFLRQTALIAIMAQIGSFVSASSAEIGIVDKLFSRIGAKDDLFHDRSTFMVEMLETAEILRRATPRSLVIMDEVGRGTTVRDGLAIAYATVHHLSLHNKCRALFATHFHELVHMLGCSDHGGHGLHSHIRFFCTDVDEIDENHFTYSYRLRPGINRDSHGLKVAQLAGMPTMAMQVAKDALARLKGESSEMLSHPKANISITAPQ